MSFLGKPDLRDLMKANLWTLTGGSFTQGDILQKTNSSDLLLVFVENIPEVSYLDFVLRNPNAAAGATPTINLEDAAIPTNSLSFSQAIPAKQELSVRMPWSTNLSRLRISGAEALDVEVFRIGVYPIVPTQTRTAWGAAEGVAKATTGAGVTDNGFDANKVHTFTVTTGNNSGMDYTVTPLPVNAATWYRLAITAPVFAGSNYTLTVGGITYTGTGNSVILLDNTQFNANPVTVKYNNLSGSNKTTSVAWSKLVFDPRANVWISNNTIGV